MGYIYEQRMSQETKDYLESLHLKTPSGRDFDYRWVGPAIVEEETHNVFFALAGHLVYPLLVWDYVFVYKNESVIMEVESKKIIENRIRSIRIPETIEKEKDNVVKIVIDLFFKFQKELAFKSNKETAEKIVLNTDNIEYYK